MADAARCAPPISRSPCSSGAIRCSSPPRAPTACWRRPSRSRATAARSSSRSASARRSRSREPGKARLTLPAIVDRNFSISADAGHSVWIESRQGLNGSPGLAASEVDGRLFRISGTLDDRALSGTRQSITVDRSLGANTRVSRLGDGEAVVQEIARAEPTRTLMLVIDGSARLAGAATKIIAALDAIPAGTRVGVIIAGEPIARIPLAPWSDAQKAAAIKLIRSASFSGGQDNAPALADALLALETEPQATLLWIHGPQPVNFAGSTARLEQATARLTRLPKIVLYSVEPGPNEVLPDAPWAWGARSLPQTGAIDVDLAGFLVRSTGETPDDPPQAGTGDRRRCCRLRSHRAAVGERARARAHAQPR